MESVGLPLIASGRRQNVLQSVAVRWSQNVRRWKHGFWPDGGQSDLSADDLHPCGRVRSAFKSLQTAGKMLLKNLRPSTEEEARQAIMERRRRGAVEEPEPRSTFDRPSWEQFKLKMEDELSAHPDRDDARSALNLAIRHLEWLAKLAKKARIEFGFMPETLIPVPIHRDSHSLSVRG